MLMKPREDLTLSVRTTWTRYIGQHLYKFKVIIRRDGSSLIQVYKLHDAVNTWGLVHEWK